MNTQTQEDELIMLDDFFSEDIPSIIDDTVEDDTVVTEEEKPEESTEDPVEDKEVETEETEDTTSFYKNLASELKEKNLLLDDDDVTDDESFIKKFETSIDSRVEEKLSKDYDLDNPRVKQMLDYLHNGGDIEAYIEVEQELDSNIDLDDEDELEGFMKYALKNFNGMDDDEDIDTYIENLKLNGKLKPNAEKYMAKIDSLKAKKQQELVQNQAIQKQEALKRVEETKSKLEEFLTKGEAGEYKFEKSKEFNNFIFKPVVKNNRNTTEFKEKLNEYLSDHQKFIKLSHYLYNDLSPTIIEKQAEKKAASTLYDKMKSKGTITTTKKEKNSDFELTVL
jgi:hypothetical protein